MKKLLFCFISFILMFMAILMPSFNTAFANTPTPEDGATFIMPAILNETEDNAFLIHANESVLKVKGTGKISVDPDVAYLKFAVKTTDALAANANLENSRKMNMVYDVLDLFGVPSENVKSTSYNVHPKYSYATQEAKQVGFEITSELSVKLTDTELAGKVIDRLTHIGVNNIYGVEFAKENTDGLYQQALQLALQNANSKANMLAGSFNKTEAKLVEFEEQNNGGYSPISTFVKYSMDAASTGEASTKLSSGKISICAEVTCQYELV